MTLAHPQVRRRRHVDRLVVLLLPPRGTSPASACSTCTTGCGTAIACCPRAGWRTVPLLNPTSTTTAGATGRTGGCCRVAPTACSSPAAIGASTCSWSPPGSRGRAQRRQRDPPRCGAAPAARRGGLLPDPGLTHLGPGRARLTRRLAQSRPCRCTCRPRCVGIGQHHHTGANSSLARVPPAARAATMRSRASSWATVTSMWKRSRSVRGSSTCWNHRADRGPGGRRGCRRPLAVAQHRGPKGRMRPGSSCRWPPRRVRGRGRLRRHAGAGRPGQIWRARSTLTMVNPPASWVVATTRTRSG